MRLKLLGLAPVLLASAAAFGQQDAPAAQPAGVNEQAAAFTQPSGVHDISSADDPIARGDAKAAARAQKDKAKADAKALKQAQKDKKEAEEDAKFLKLQDNEIVISAFDEQGNAVKLPPCSKKDKLCQEKRKALLKEKKIPLTVRNGTLTVDGWTGKARLNYDIRNFQYVYISVPDYGTVVVSPDHFPNSTELKEAMDGKTMTITTADDHTVQLASDSDLSGKQKRSLFYSVDRGYHQPGNYPTIGYGFVNKAPYAWPGTLPLTDDQRRSMANAPNLPRGMQAHEMVLPCQAVAVGASPRPVKLNGIFITPRPCKSGEVAATPGAYDIGNRPPDGSGAASTGIAENH